MNFEWLKENQIRKTFLYDCLRSFGGGVLETGPRTFFLLIAIRQFQAENAIKSAVAIPSHFGMLMAIMLVGYLTHSIYKKSTWLSALYLVSALCFLTASFSTSAVSYTIWVFVAASMRPISLPLLTSIYRENYPSHLRGKLFSLAFTVHIAASALFHWLGGILLERDIAHFKTLTLGYAFFALLGAVAVKGIPSSSGKAGVLPAKNPLKALHWVVRDPQFGIMLAIWFIFGFANLVTMPLRVIYLTEPEYDLVFSPTIVALAVGIIPDVTRFMLTPLWGAIFDRFNFLYVRIVLNVFMILAIFTFFNSISLWFILLASVFYGVFLAGGNVAWNLWVTKYADPEHTAEYMSVHQFFTGVRGVIGGIAGIYLASDIGIKPISWFATGLIFISIILIIPQKKIMNRLK